MRFACPCASKCLTAKKKEDDAAKTMYMSASTCTSPVYESNSVAGSSEIGGECRPAAEALVCVESWDKFLVDTPATQGAGMPVYEILKTATPSYKTNADSLLTPERFNRSFLNNFSFLCFNFALVRSSGGVHVAECTHQTELSISMHQHVNFC